MDYLDETTSQLIILSFIIILIVFLIPLCLDIIASFFKKIFNIRNKYEK